MKQYSSAIIGTGRIGYSLQFDKKREQPASHSSALTSNKRIKLIAGVDTDSKNLLNWSKSYPKARIFDSVENMLKELNPDIITVAVNESSHLEVTKKCILAKPKLIILEKPVALDVNQAIEIKNLAEKHKVPIMINHERRFSIDYVKVKSLIDSGKLGNIESIYATLSSSMRIYNQKEEKSGHYSLIHDGTHLIDIIKFLTGKSLLNPIFNRIGYDDDNSVRYLSVSYDINNTLINIELSGNRKYFGFDIEIKGSSGKILIGNGYCKYYTTKESPFYTGFFSLVRNRILKRPKKTKYFSNMINNAINFLDGNEPLQSNLIDGIDALTSLKEIETKLKF